MAKITARGDKEIARWRKPNGAYIVLTERGRLLTQILKGDTYKLLGVLKVDSEARRKRASAYAARRDAVEVPTR